MRLQCCNVGRLNPTQLLNVIGGNWVTETVATDRKWVISSAPGHVLDTNSHQLDSIGSIRLFHGFYFCRLVQSNRCRGIEVSKYQSFQIGQSSPIKKKCSEEWPPMSSKASNWRISSDHQQEIGP